jgi:hypothetical protein
MIQNSLQRRWMSGVASVVSCVFLWTSTVLAAPNAVYQIKVSEEKGRIIKRWKGTSDTVVVHIQDAHSNSRAQKNIASIIDTLVSEDPSYEIGAEGGWSRLEVESLRQFPYQTTRNDVAEYILDEGSITGLEYAALVSETPLTVQGVEDKGLFCENLSLLREALQLSRQNGLDEEIKIIEQALENLKTPVWDEDLRAFDDTFRAKSGDTSKLIDCADLLYKACNEYSIDRTQYLSFSMLVELVASSQNIDHDMLAQHAERIEETLLSMVDDPQAFQNKIPSAEGSQKDRDEWFVYLARQCEHYSIQDNDAEALKRFAEYYHRYSSLDLNGVLNDMDSLRWRLYELKAKSRDARALVMILRNASMLKEILTFRANESVVTFAEEHPSVFKVEQMATIVQRLHEKYGFTCADFSTCAMQQIVPYAQRFYSAAQARSEKMVENILARTGDTQRKILVAGGFHSDDICRSLQERGISYVVVTPTIDDALVENQYWAKMSGELAASMSYIQNGVLFDDALPAESERLREFLNRLMITTAGIKELLANDTITGSASPDARYESFHAMALDFITSLETYLAADDSVGEERASEYLEDVTLLLTFLEEPIKKEVDTNVVFRQDQLSGIIKEYYTNEANKEALQQIMESGKAVKLALEAMLESDDQGEIFMHPPADKTPSSTVEVAKGPIKETPSKNQDVKKRAETRGSLRENFFSRRNVLVFALGSFMTIAPGFIHSLSAQEKKPAKVKTEQDKNSTAKTKEVISFTYGEIEEELAPKKPGEDISPQDNGNKPKKPTPKKKPPFAIPGNAGFNPYLAPENINQYFLGGLGYGPNGKVEVVMYSNRDKKNPLLSGDGYIGLVDFAYQGPHTSNGYDIGEKWDLSLLDFNFNDPRNRQGFGAKFNWFETQFLLGGNVNGSNVPIMGPYLADFQKKSGAINGLVLSVYDVRGNYSHSYKMSKYANFNVEGNAALGYGGILVNDNKTYDTWVTTAGGLIQFDVTNGGRQSYTTHPIVLSVYAAGQAVTGGQLHWDGLEPGETIKAGGVTIMGGFGVSLIFPANIGGNIVYFTMSGDSGGLIDLAHKYDQREKGLFEEAYGGLYLGRPVYQYHAANNLGSTVKVALGIPVNFGPGKKMVLNIGLKNERDNLHDLKNLGQGIGVFVNLAPFIHAKFGNSDEAAQKFSEQEALSDVPGDFNEKIEEGKKAVQEKIKAADLRGIATAAISELTSKRIKAILIEAGRNADEADTIARTIMEQQMLQSLTTENTLEELFAGDTLSQIVDSITVNYKEAVLDEKGGFCMAEAQFPSQGSEERTLQISIAEELMREIIIGLNSANEEEKAQAKFALSDLLIHELIEAVILRSVEQKLSGVALSDFEKQQIAHKLTRDIQKGILNDNRKDNPLLRFAVRVVMEKSNDKEKHFIVPPELLDAMDGSDFVDQRQEINYALHGGQDEFLEAQALTAMRTTPIYFMTSATVDKGTLEKPGYDLLQLCQETLKMYKSLKSKHASENRSIDQLKGDIAEALKSGAEVQNICVMATEREIATLKESFPGILAISLPDNIDDEDLLIDMRLWIDWANVGFLSAQLGHIVNDELAEGVLSFDRIKGTLGEILDNVKVKARKLFKESA